MRAMCEAARRRSLASYAIAAPANTARECRFMPPMLTTPSFACAAVLLSRSGDRLRMRKMYAPFFAAFRTRPRSCFHHSSPIPRLLHALSPPVLRSCRVALCPPQSALLGQAVDLHRRRAVAGAHKESMLIAAYEPVPVRRAARR